MAETSQRHVTDASPGSDVRGEGHRGRDLSQLKVVIPKSHSTYCCGRLFKNLQQLDKPEVLFHHFFLQGAEPEMTCVGDFGNLIGRSGIHTDTLDYVWFSHGTLQATGAMGTPERSVLLSLTGLPSPMFPSDHLPLKARFKVL